MDEQSRLADQMPANIGRYKVLDLVGFGAMGAVYKAFDPLIKRTLAIKTIRLDIPRQSPQYRSFIERFYHEARISGTLAHANIVTLYDIGEEGGVPYLAMEFVEGETIAAMLEKGIRFKPERVIALASQVAAALDYAHTKGVIHRDIKPSNLILFEGDRVKVTDFGIAKLMDAEMTQSGTLLGTPSYMSPEQAMGEKLDGRSDIFSLGVCAFEMLSGEQPFPGTNVTSILYKLVHVDPIEPANLEMHGLVPQKWHEVFGRVLAKKPDDRYQTAGAFVQDLEYCLGSWFGSIGEPTLYEASQPQNEGTATLPRMAVPDLSSVGPDDDPTTLLPTPAPSPAAMAPPPSIAALVEDEPSPAEDVPATVILKSATASGSDPATVVLKAQPPSTPSAAAPQAPAEATAVLRTAAVPVTAAPAVEALEPTMAMDAPFAAAEATVVMKTPVSQRVPMKPRLSEERTARVAAPPPTAPVPRPVSRPKGSKAGALPLVPSTPEPTASAAVPPIAPRRTGMPVGAILGGVGALLVVMALGIGFVVWRNQGEAPAPEPVPTEVAPTAAPTVVPQVRGTLKVESRPAGAMVVVNGETKGAAPLEFGDLPLGTYEVRLALKGYEAKSETVTLSEAAPVADLSVVLSRPQPALLPADFVSTPEGASLTIDGTTAGSTPVTGYKLRPGSHEVEMTKDGYEPWSGSVTVKPGAPARLEATLRPVVKATPVPAPTAETVDVNRVYLNTPAEVDTVAKKTAGPSVSYPSSAPRLRSGDSVSVTVSFVVDEDGQVTDVKILESGGRILDEAVSVAVQKWKYAPAVKKGIKVRVRHTVKQTFRAG
jgi:serine/threonine-protein kinase